MEITSLKDKEGVDLTARARQCEAGTAGLQAQALSNQPPGPWAGLDSRKKKVVVAVMMMVDLPLPVTTVGDRGRQTCPGGSTDRISSLS